MFSPTQLLSAGHALKAARGVCSLNAAYRGRTDLGAALDAVGAALDDQNGTDAIESARRAQAIVDEIGKGLGPTLPRRANMRPPRFQLNMAKTPQKAMADLVSTLDGSDG